MAIHNNFIQGNGVYKLQTLSLKNTNKKEELVAPDKEEKESFALNNENDIKETPQKVLNWIDLQEEFIKPVIMEKIVKDKEPPISPTRMIVRFSPYFRGFFPEKDIFRPTLYFAPLLEQKQFQNHFFYKTRMILFEPCNTYLNLKYEYSVKKLTKTETNDFTKPKTIS